MNDALRRGTRTFLDIAFVEAVLQLLIAFGADFNEAQHAAILVVAPFFISSIKNTLEDSGAIPALLKAPASEGVNPVPDPEPVPVKPVRKPRKRVVRDDGQSLVHVLLVVLLIAVILKLLL